MENVDDTQQAETEDLLARYVSGWMTDEEKRLFEKRLEVEPELSSQFNQIEWMFEPMPHGENRSPETPNRFRIICDGVL
jgi:anti-sigma-K factor RskA